MQRTGFHSFCLQIQRFAVVLACGLFCLGSHATAAEKLPEELENVGVKPKLGAQLDLSTKFTDENGRAVTLGDYFDGKTPVLLMMAYYECPMLCGLMINQATDTLKKFDWQMGKQYKMVTISIDPNEEPYLARDKKDTVRNAFPTAKQQGVESSWAFLTGPEASSKKVGDQLGFYYNFIEEKNEYAHGSALFIVSPNGKVSRALTGLSYSVRDIKLALLDASNGKVGNLVERMFSTCFKFDPTLHKYTLFATRLMKIACIMFVLFLGLIYLVIFNKKRIITRHSES